MTWDRSKWGPSFRTELPISARALRSPSKSAKQHDISFACKWGANDDEESGELQITLFHFHRSCSVMNNINNIALLLESLTQIALPVPCYQNINYS